MYGNCKICGQRFGTADGKTYYEPCKHMNPINQAKEVISKWPKRKQDLAKGRKKESKMNLDELINILQNLIDENKVTSDSQVYFRDESDYPSESQISFVDIDEDGDIILSIGE